MCHALLQDPAFFRFLSRIDAELAADRRQARCIHCSGPQHSADFPRKPRGCPAAVREEYSRRLSLTCGWCEARATPASVRFLGRRLYVAVIRPMCQRRRYDLLLMGKIAAIRRRSRDTYGAPNIHAELADDHGIRVGRKRVARLMRQNGIRGATLRKFVVTTHSDSAAPKPIDLVERRFFAETPDQLWVADMTYIPTWSGWLYLAMVLDVYSRKIVGWAMDTNMRTELILDALQMAVTQRQPRRVIHHSDRGSQYTSYAFGKRCQEAGIMPSMGSVGDAYDNAMAESFFATLERELLNRWRFRSQAEARMAVFEWIEGWYNPHRRHSGLGYRSPINYERVHHQARARMAELLPPAAADSLSGKISKAA